MRETVNIYCDESCHLENDQSESMAIGAVYCPESKKTEIFQRIREIKVKHNLVPRNKKSEKNNRAQYEMKWNKISSSKLDFYEEVINYFFDDDDLRFRVLVVKDKKKVKFLDHGFTHDTVYYLMYFKMLKPILNPEKNHKIYIDIKDTRSREKVDQLKDVLRDNKYDYSKLIIKKIQQVRSHEIELIQLADLLTGAISYVHRGLETSTAKLTLIKRIRERSKYSLLKPTLSQEKKFNISIWEDSKKE